MALILNWLVKALVILVVAYVVPGFRVLSLTSAIWLALILGLLNILVRPLLILITLPLNILTLGLFTLIINAIVLLLAARVVEGVNVDGFGAVLVASILMSLINMMIERIR